MSQKDRPACLRWARLRHSIVGQLLASPPAAGELWAKIVEVSEREWKHPTRDEMVRYSPKTIESWYYAARSEDDPLRALERKVPKHAGTHPSISERLATVIAEQYRDHPSWTYHLHHINLCALAEEDKTIGEVPTYATIRRYMKDQGLYRQKKGKSRGKAGVPGIVPRETRSYEVTHVHGLWHTDFHCCSRSVLCESGEWKKPVLFAVLDDASRLCCHAQWYFVEDTEALVHGLSQGIQKRELCRALLRDRGGAMIAAEVEEGLERLGILDYTTLPRSPEQNGKMEVFWVQIESQLMPMLEGVQPLTLSALNEATQAWVELDYHRTVHRELGETPLRRFLRGPSVGRKSPSSEELRRAFRMEVTRTQRRSDGTITVEGVRFELPSAYRTLETVRVRVARWDLSSVDLVDARTGKHLAVLLPLDKAKNADRARRPLQSVASEPASQRASGIAPHLRRLIAEYAATGLPPAYLPKDDLGAEAGVVETASNEPTADSEPEEET